MRKTAQFRAVHYTMYLPPRLREPFQVLKWKLAGRGEALTSLLIPALEAALEREQIPFQKSG